MTIRTNTVYRYDGKEFSDLSKVQKYIENEIGKIIDSTPMRLTPKDALAVYDVIVSNSKRLIGLLSAKYEHEVVEQSHYEDKSIFDL